MTDLLLLAAKAVHAHYWHDEHGDCEDPSGCGPTKDDVAVVRTVLAVIRS